ncbi:hypothetical protein AK37_03438 [Rhodococcus pyridinivorans AK37]|uniref:Mobilization protein n=2 Tax=Rhodococcus pyridinivorans TaxID=103816 RepID=H0JM69_9NOCA|nr:hypothetical protein AK37_03438 [Rhodococcus pyridinivorans AK37]
MDDTSEAKLSDKIPAGRVSVPTSPSNAVGAETSQETLDSRLDVRVSCAEREAIGRRARALGVKPSAWARAVLRDALDDRRAEVALLERAAARPRASTASAAEVEQLRRLGINLNGLRRDAATARKAGDAVTVVVDGALLEEVLAGVTALRAELGDRTRS